MSSNLSVCSGALGLEPPIVLTDSTDPPIPPGTENPVERHRATYVGGGVHLLSAPSVVHNGSENMCTQHAKNKNLLDSSLRSLHLCCIHESAHLIEGEHIKGLCNVEAVRPSPDRFSQRQRPACPICRLCYVYGMFEG